MAHKPDKARRYDKNRYREAKEKGLCVFHGCGTPTTGTYCSVHAEYYRRMNKKYKRLKEKATSEYLN